MAMKQVIVRNIQLVEHWPGKGVASLSSWRPFKASTCIGLLDGRNSFDIVRYSFGAFQGKSAVDAIRTAP